MTGTRIEPAWFEGLYQRDPDPWKFATSPYERDKYARTLEALGAPTGDSSEPSRPDARSASSPAPGLPLRANCSASTRSLTAVGRARDRLAGPPACRSSNASCPSSCPAGPFDLIVCSELLYYWSAEPLRELLRRSSRALIPGAAWSRCTGDPETRTYPLRGDDVHRIIAETTELAHGHSEQHDLYLLDRYDRPR